jgi:hypothetical protein
MKITNTHLIDILLWSGIQANLLVDSFSIIWKLIKRHGKMLYTEKYIKEILISDKNIWELLSILKKTDKIKYQDTKNLINMIKTKSSNYKLEFSVNSNSNDHNDEIKSKLNKQFKDSNINTDVIDDIWINVSGEWRYYKKNLDADLDKILGK